MAMLARDIATRRVIQVDAAQSLRDAAQIMYRHQVSCLVVGDETSSSGPVGMLTHSDVAAAVLVECRDPDATAVASVMSRPPVQCRDDSTLTEIISIMRGDGLRRLPMVDAEGRLAGIITADDVIVTMAGLMEGFARALVIDPPLDQASR